MAKPIATRFISTWDRDQHFEDHQSEFTPPFDSAADYEQAAAEFFNRPWSGSIIDNLRVRDGFFLRFNPDTDELVICDGDGFVRTYYKPDPNEHGEPDNVTYFRGQCQ